MTSRSSETALDSLPDVRLETQDQKNLTFTMPQTQDLSDHFGGTGSGITDGVRRKAAA
jgi:hypothetical protein